MGKANLLIARTPFRAIHYPLRKVFHKDEIALEKGQIDYRAGVQTEARAAVWGSCHLNMMNLTRQEFQPGSCK